MAGDDVVQTTLHGVLDTESRRGAKVDSEMFVDETVIRSCLTGVVHRCGFISESGRGEDREVEDGLPLQRLQSLIHIARITDGTILHPKQPCGY